MSKKIEIHTTKGEWQSYKIEIEDGTAVVESSYLDNAEEFDSIEEMARFFNDYISFPLESYCGYEINNEDDFIEYCNQ